MPTKAQLEEQIKAMEETIANMEAGLPADAEALPELPEQVKHEDFATAYFHLQQDIQPIHKGGWNPHFKSQYSELTDVHAGTKIPLYKHGFRIEHTTTYDDALGFVMLTTRLIHETGDYNKADWPIFPAQKTNPQEVGKQMTYGRRYNEMLLCNLAPGEKEDDDGEAGRKASQPRQPQGRPATKQASKGAQPQKPPGKAAESDTITAPQLKKLNTVGKMAYPEDWEDVRPKTVKWHTSKTRGAENAVTSSTELTKSEAGKLIELLEQKVQKALKEE